MASLGCEQQIATNNQTAESVAKVDTRDGGMDRKDRDEKLKLARERQNEERQRKIEELKAQAEAAQRYREQKEEERRRRIDEIRHRDIEKRQQVEERKKAIIEAEKERREYIIKKNEERESRLEAKKKERNSIVFAFGSSTPRLLESDFGMVSPSTFWSNRRSTSISNVAGASLSRRSSERELVDCVSKKRATSASGSDRHDVKISASRLSSSNKNGHRRKSSSMYEVFNWGNSIDKPPKRVSLSIVGGEINIDDPPPSTYRPQILFSTHSPNYNYLKAATNDYASKEEKVDTSHIIFRSVARRKTDLMPTIPSPRDGYYGSRSSLSNTPKTPGRAFSLNRLDQLAQPIRRNGEHIHSILERERRNQCMEMLEETEYLHGGQRLSKRCNAGSCSRSMSHLAGGRKYNMGGGISSNFRPLSGSNRESCRSMTQLTTSWSTTQTIGTKQCLQTSFAIPSTKRGQHFTNTYRFHPQSLLLMSSSFVTTGSRSGNVTPGDSINTSRPGSAMSISTNLSTSGNLSRRSGAPIRKPRPASIAGTGVSLEEINKLKKDNKPLLTSSSVHSAHTTPKRTSNMMSTSLILNSSSSRLSSAEKKTPCKKESFTTKFSTSKPLSKTTSVDKLNKSNKEQKPKYAPPMNRSSLVTSSAASMVATDITSDQRASSKSKDEKNALNAVKTEEPNNSAEGGPVLDNASFPIVIDEKIDQGNEKDSDITKKINSGSKENSEVRDLTEAVDMMSVSMISKSKITTEEEAKAALAERRRIAREEAEKLAELERQRLESERLAQKKQQEEEVERQRQFEEEAIRLAAEQRKAEEERLRQAIEETKQRERDEQLKREEEENLKVEREEAEKKAKEEAEKQRLEVAERLKREEKEREERRKRVEAIMSRTRKVGAATTPNTTPVKENNENSNKTVSAEQIQQPEKKQLITAQNNVGSNPTTPTVTTITSSASAEPKFSKSMYEESLADKELSIIKTSSMVNEENTKNLQQQPSSKNVEIANLKLKHPDFSTTEVLLLNTNTTNLTVANGNGHIGNINNKTDFNILQDVLVASTNQVIDHSIESQDINNSPTLNNNNSLLSKANTLVTADSQENKDISLL